MLFFPAGRRLAFVSGRQLLVRICAMAAGDPTGSESVRDRLRHLAPVLDDSRHKGQAGRIAIVGGCREYTGAPWFAAMSALRVGADLSHVFCTSSASQVIKSYSPELIVHPSLPDADLLRGLELNARIREWSSAAHEITGFFPRLDALVIGPGLGRDESVLTVAEMVLRSALDANLPLVLDGDGLFIVTQKPELLTSRRPGGAGCLSVILTPNVNEYRRLCDALSIEATEPSNLEASKKTLAHMSCKLGGAVIVRKGHLDLIAAGDSPVLECTEPGAPRRCGGQGDVLAGSTAVFAAWAQRGAAPLQHAALAACTLVRATAARTFAVKRRSMVAGDLLPELGPTFESIAPA